MKLFFILFFCFSLISLGDKTTARNLKKIKRPFITPEIVAPKPKIVVYHPQDQNKHVQYKPTNQQVQNQHVQYYPPTNQQVQNQPTYQHVQNQPTYQHVQNQPTYQHVQYQPTYQHVQYQPTFYRPPQNYYIPFTPAPFYYLPTFRTHFVVNNEYPQIYIKNNKTNCLDSCKAVLPLCENIEISTDNTGVLKCTCNRNETIISHKICYTPHKCIISNQYGCKPILKQIKILIRNKK